MTRMTSDRHDLADSPPAPQDRTWKDLATIADVELWIAEHDQELQRYVTKSYSTGHGICFTLAAGGDIFLHTTGDGDVVLDVTADAAWATPVIRCLRFPDGRSLAPTCLHFRT